MPKQSLGRLIRVDRLRDVWDSESRDFTPWLAQEDSLAILEETLGVDLELEATEKSVGPFRADILCRDAGSNSWVLIENQLERTDHNHLGQLLTYASGLEAATIVWIASHFTEEHRATLDWLNRITDERFRFFGLEVELWRIDGSPCAPKFNIVSKPNDWSRSVARATRGELSDTELFQQEYWTAFSRALQEADGPVSSNAKALHFAFMMFPIGTSNFCLQAAITRTKQNIRAELYISGEDANAFFHLLHMQKRDVEKELDCSPEWKELPGAQGSRIAIYNRNVDPGDRKDWHGQHKWLVAKLNDLHRVFSKRVSELDAEDWYRHIANTGNPSPPQEQGS